MLTIALLCLLPIIAIMGGIYALSFRHSSGPVSLPYYGNTFRFALSVIWLFLVFFTYRRATWYAWDLVDDSFLLTTVSPLTEILSILLSESLLLYLIFLVPTLGVLGVLLYGFVNPISIVLIPLTTGLFVTTACSIGYTLGFAMLDRGKRGDTTRNRGLYLGVRILVALVIIGYFLSTFGVGPQITIQNTSLVYLLPPGWLLDLAAIGTRIVTSPSRAGLVVLGGLVVDVVGVALVYRFALAYWYGTVDSETDSGTPSRTDESIPHPDGDHDG